jgi:predicted amidophosphoribosyltransferase
LTALVCPNCNVAALHSESQGVLICDHCHAHIVQGQLECPSCQSLNPIGMETCSVCGEPLTIVGRVISRQGSQTKSQRLEQMRARAGVLKEEARVSSEVRMTEFVKIDRRRIEREREESYIQQLRDRLLFRNVAIGLGVFLLIVAVVTLVVIL